MVSLIELYERIGYDVEFAMDLFEGFIDDARDIIGELRKGLSGSDMSVVSAAAHNIKGAAQNLSVTPLEMVSRRIEAVAKGQAQEDLSGLIEEITTTVDALEVFIQQDGWAVLSTEDQAKIG